MQDLQGRITKLATSCSSTEKKLGLHLGGYLSRAKTLRQKTVGAAEALQKAKTELETKHFASYGEDAAIAGRLERLRSEVESVMRRERQAQGMYRERKAELQALTGQIA